MLASALPLLLSWPGGGDFHSGAPANGDQLQYVHAPLDFIRRHWEAQKKPSPGPAIDFNTTFGIVGLNAIRAPAKITFPYPGSGRSLPIKNAATDFTAVLPMLLGGSALTSNSYMSVFTNDELVHSCARVYNVTTHAGVTWSVPLSVQLGSVQPITTLKSSDHRTFDVDASLCSSTGDADAKPSAAGHCCGYFDPSQNNTLSVQSVATECRDLLFVGELYGFVYPRIDFIYVKP